MQNETIYKTTTEATNMEFITRLNIMLSTNCNHQENINAALGLIGKFICHDRIHIIEIQNNMHISILYEWHIKELTATGHEIKLRQMLTDKALEAQLYSQDFIVIDESDETINPEIKALLSSQHAKKIILFPLYESGAQFAFIAFIQCNQKHDWDKSEIHLMATIASIIATNLNKKFLVEKLKRQLTIQKEYKQQVASLETHLNTLQPVWQHLKEAVGTKGIDESQPHLELFDRHLYSINKICRNMAAVK